MEQSTIINSMLSMIEKPAFCVCGGKIAEVNPAALQLGLQVGMPVSEMLGSQRSAYESFSDGVLSVTLSHMENQFPCTVTRIDGCDVFTVMQDTRYTDLQALALASQHLRIPLATAMTVTDQLFPEKSAGKPELVSQLTRSLFRMQRMLCNISDTARYCDPAFCSMETTEIGSVIDEAVEKASLSMEKAGFTVHYSGLEEKVYGLADREALTRAVYNLLSNAAKFTEDGHEIDVKLTRSGNLLSFTVQDNGIGISPEILSEIYSRFERKPSIEDGRRGIGLGLALVHAVAAAHGGTVLIDQAGDRGTRVTMTLAIRSSSENRFRAPVVHIGDYAGGRDNTLLELADILPSDVY